MFLWSHRGLLWSITNFSFLDSQEGGLRSSDGTRCWSGWQTGHDCCSHCQEHHRSIAHFEFYHGRNQEPLSRIGASVHGHQHGAVRGSKEARTTSKYWLRGTRVGEASNPGPHRFHRLRRGTSSNGPSPVAVSSDEEPLVRPNMGRDVLPRFGEGPIAVPLAGPAVPRPSRRLVLVTEGEHDEPSTQPASVVPSGWLQRSILTLRVVPCLLSRCQFRIGSLLWIRLSGAATKRCQQWWTVQELKCSPCQMTQPWRSLWSHPDIGHPGGWC